VQVIHDLLQEVLNDRCHRQPHRQPAHHRRGHLVAGVTAGPGRHGEFAFTVGRRPLGHLHGDRAAHFSFPKAVWAQLRAEGRITEHPVFPGKEGPAARRIETDADVEDVIALLRLNYDRRVSTPLDRP
jgi:hypothetical protein